MTSEPPVTLTLRAIDDEVEPGYMTSPCYCPVLRTATRKVCAVYVVFLTSDDSSYVPGAQLFVNGGVALAIVLERVGKVATP